ncbi:unnamed protein product [Ranitomeya imitator]|uniref:tRNA (uracil-O(2)-)-methyltransferase n=1 Tax=Ranitomeya imitator TaxID=111125 RepID=A0ABN9LU76_9NEOB|nr:unnamed protein product [Ranitomeya imitator]
MPELGRLCVRDPGSALPAGFWAAVAVWVEKPQVLNKRLCGSCVKRGPEEEAAAAVRRLLAELQCPGGDEDVLARIRGCEGGAVTLRSVIPKSGGPGTELLLTDVSGRAVTFVPLEEPSRGHFQVRRNNIYQIRLAHVEGDEWSLSLLAVYADGWESDGVLYPKISWMKNELLPRLAKWSTEDKKSEFKSTLSLIAVDKYSKQYRRLKEKYREMVKVWPEVTDPEKFVYEDVAIATYLLAKRTVKSKHKQCAICTEPLPDSYLKNLCQTCIDNTLRQEESVKMNDIRLIIREELQSLGGGSSSVNMEKRKRRVSPPKADTSAESGEVDSEVSQLSDSSEEEDFVCFPTEGINNLVKSVRNTMGVSESKEPQTPQEVMFAGLSQRKGHVFPINQAIKDLVKKEWSKGQKGFVPISCKRRYPFDDEDLSTWTKIPKVDAAVASTSRRFSLPVEDAGSLSDPMDRKSDALLKKIVGGLCHGIQAGNFSHMY